MGSRQIFLCFSEGVRSFSRKIIFSGSPSARSSEGNVGINCFGTRECASQVEFLRRGGNGYEERRKRALTQGAATIRKRTNSYAKCRWPLSRRKCCRRRRRFGCVADGGQGNDNQDSWCTCVTGQWMNLCISYERQAAYFSPLDCGCARFI